ncbi:MAG TPA: DUF3563 domain-containing protein [Devosia sp.]|nr:DUF3563 domain-containing protein [Devosia sp.]
MGLMNTLRSRLRVRTRAQEENDYLNQATSSVDLEMRQREIDRGRFRTFPHRA